MPLPRLQRLEGLFGIEPENFVEFGLGSGDAVAGEAALFNPRDSTTTRIIVAHKVVVITLPVRVRCCPGVRPVFIGFLIPCQLRFG